MRAVLGINHVPQLVAVGLQALTELALLFCHGGEWFLLPHRQAGEGLTGALLG
ncbi:MAG: hypothetical protein OXC96_00860 [Cyanobacteria bacterium MAG CAR1_bin_15]|nr:hypothetical protein [Cyanobacteria bacterium MAG CAR1_bin_15]